MPFANLPSTNPIPTYRTEPSSEQPWSLHPKAASLFCVFEQRGTEPENYLFTMSNRSDRLGELLRRGIPADAARTLFYEMDSKPLIRPQSGFVFSQTRQCWESAK